MEADTLSRIRHKYYTQIIPKVVKAITTAIQTDDLSNFICRKEQVVSKAVHTTPSQKITPKQLQDEQQNDQVILEVLRALKKKLKSSEFKDEDIRCLLRHRNCLFIRNQLLYHKYVDSITGIEMLQFVLPTSFLE